jgi:hypothetical protein
VTYRERQRLADIQAAIDAIRSHLQRGDLSDGLVFDAVRIRLLEIGDKRGRTPRRRAAKPRTTNESGTSDLTLGSTLMHAEKSASPDNGAFLSTSHRK